MKEGSYDEQRLEQEIENRITIMESMHYDFGPPINKVEIIAIVSIAMICVIGMVWAYFLRRWFYVKSDCNPSNPCMEAQ